MRLDDLKNEFPDTPEFILKKVNDTIIKQINTESTQTQKHIRFNGKSFLYKVAAAVGALIFTTGTTAFAANSIHMQKTVRIFFKQGITSQQIDEIENAVSKMTGVQSYRFVNSDTAWDEFAEEYLTKDMQSSFEENPLADSENIEAKIVLFDDTDKVITQIEEIDGVRLVSTLAELKEQEKENN